MPTETPRTSSARPAGEKGCGIRSADDDDEMRLGLLAEGLYSFAETTSPGAEPEVSSAFSIPRLRRKREGHIFDPNLGYSVVLEFGKGGFATLKDGYLDWKFALGARLRAGQFKRPFSRQQVTSDGKLAFVDRPTRWRSRSTSRPFR